MAIPFYEQYYVEKSRNNTVAWLAYTMGIVALCLYGLIFHWLQILLRSKRHERSLKYRAYFGFLKWWDWFNGSIEINLRIPFIYPEPVMFQPSLVLLYLLFMGFNILLMLVNSKDINYEDHYYIVSKRIGRVAVGNLPFMYLFVLKHNIVSMVTGLPGDKVNLLHRWIGRLVWAEAVAHMYYGLRYWLGMNFLIMVEIPPQIFGMIAICCMTIVTWAGARIFRRLSYEFFLFNHGLFAGIMALMVVFHNPGTRTLTIIAIHTIVIDRVLMYIGSFAKKKLAPTHCEGKARIISPGTVELVIPMVQRRMKIKYLEKLPIYFGKWRAGQHIYLNIHGIRRVQWHPFTIASVPETGNMRFIIRTRTGFTKGLEQKVEKLRTSNADLCGTVDLVCKIHGAYGADIIPLITFDSVLFVAGGSGGSFTFPLAEDLIAKIRDRNRLADYLGRPNHSHIRVIWYISHEDQLCWYEPEIKGLLARADEAGNSSDRFGVSVSLECYVTRPKDAHNIVIQDSCPSYNTKREGVQVSVSNLASGSSLSSCSSNVDDEPEYGVDMTEENIGGKDLILAKHSFDEEEPGNVKMKNDIITTTTSESSSSSTSSELPFVKREAHFTAHPCLGIHKHKPSIHDIISQESSVLNSSQSMAVITCGPTLLTNSIQVECQKARKTKDSPDIYAYVEKYVV